MRRADVPVEVSVMISFAKFVVDASTTAVATSAQSDLSKCFEETLGLARTLSEPLLRRPQNLRHKSKLVVVSR